MDRRIQDDLRHDEIRERLRFHVLNIPETKRPADLQELAEWKPLTTSQKAKIDRLFDEKVNFLTERQPRFDPRLAETLQYLHKYRNEAYHRAKVRRETIRTAALILLEINCQLILSLRPGSMCFASDEDYSWIRERFGLDPMRTLMGDAELKAMVDVIRSGVLPSDESVAITLAEHLESRFEELYAALDFVVESLVGVPGPEAALKKGQYFAEAERGTLDTLKCSLDGFAPKYTLNSLEKIQERLPEILKTTGRLDAFHRFSLLEKELEPIEVSVHRLADEVEQMIQLEIDVRRGK